MGREAGGMEGDPCGRKAVRLGGHREDFQS